MDCGGYQLLPAWIIKDSRGQRTSVHIYLFLKCKDNSYQEESQSVINSFLHTGRTLAGSGRPPSAGSMEPRIFLVARCHLVRTSQAELLDLTCGMWHRRAAPRRGCEDARPQPSPQISGHPSLCSTSRGASESLATEPQLTSA